MSSLILMQVAAFLMMVLCSVRLVFLVFVCLLVTTWMLIDWDYHFPFWECGQYIYIVFLWYNWTHILFGFSTYDISTDVMMLAPCHDVSTDVMMPALMSALMPWCQHWCHDVDVSTYVMMSALMPSLMPWCQHQHLCHGVITNAMMSAHNLSSSIYIYLYI